MDHRGLRARLTGADCASCGAAIPPGRIDVLADRGDIAFVELACATCGSRMVSVVISVDPAGTRLDTTPHPELDPATEARLAGARALDEQDVDGMRRFLADWTGDIRSLLDASGPLDGPVDPGGRA